MNEKKNTSATLDPVVKASHELKTAISSLKTSMRTARQEVLMGKEGEELKNSDLTVFIVDELITLTREVIEIFSEFGNTFTPTERSRMVGAGIKNYGFIQTACDSASANPTLVPGYLDVPTLKVKLFDIGQKHNLYSIAQQYARNISDGMLADGDLAYHDAVGYYNYVKEAAKQHVPGAEAEYSRMKPFFKHSKPLTLGGIPVVNQQE